VAFDTGGKKAVKESIEAANPTYPCLIDEQHRVAELYGMVNVPSAVWINEEGRIVRPPEPAGWNDAWRTGNSADLEQSKTIYFDALRNWVQLGDASPYALTADEIKKRMPEPANEHSLAAAHFRMGLYLTEQGDLEEAKHHFDTAILLQPESWNFKRQSWTLVDSIEVRRNKFLKAVEALGDRPYYPPVDLSEKKV
jgi:tetratricopeptide (TPR) repeat protein